MIKTEERFSKRAYGFEEITLLPSRETIDPEEVDISWKIGNLKFKIPIISAAMDAVTDPDIAILMTKFGGLGVLNLEGLYTRYENPKEVLEKIIQEKSVEALQKVYAQPINWEIAEKRIKEIKKEGGIVAVSATPGAIQKIRPLIDYLVEIDILVVQSTVTTAKYSSLSSDSLSLSDLCQKLPIPVIVGNCGTFKAALDLMEAGAAALLVGIGPGLACTTRYVTGLYVPQATAIAEVARAREKYFKKTSRYVSVIADGGMQKGGDIAKAIACGADAVMLGSPLARASEAKGAGYNWGMATPHPVLPRGKLIHLGTCGSLKEILFGPAKVDDGTMNLVGALKLAMGYSGAKNLKEMQKAEIAVISK